MANQAAISQLAWPSYYIDIYIHCASHLRAVVVGEAQQDRAVVGGGVGVRGIVRVAGVGVVDRLTVEAGSRLTRYSTTKVYFVSTAPASVACTV